VKYSIELILGFLGNSVGFHEDTRFSKFFTLQNIIISNVRVIITLYVVITAINFPNN